MKEWRLEMRSASDLCPKDTSPDGFELNEVSNRCPELNRLLHSVVGAKWKWGGRRGWGHDRWRDFVDRQELRTWIAYIHDKPAGYGEIEMQPDGSAQITCFGLRREFIGQGFGGRFITEVVRRCWETGASRVWLDTCSNDHPNAVNNYLARGFTVVREEECPD